MSNSVLEYLLNSIRVMIIKKYALHDIIIHTIIILSKKHDFNKVFSYPQLG